MQTGTLPSAYGAKSITKNVRTVSVVIPCFNEERFIGKALESLAGQYEPERYEIIVADGQSVDQTRQVITDFAQSRPELTIRVVDNPAKNIPTGLNVGVASAHGEIIARMDAHAAPPEGYIRRCVEVLEQEDVAVVGMPCYVRPGSDTTIAKAIALAVSNKFGIGDAKYRLQGGQLGQEAVDTVAFACFRKSLWLELGGFNQSLLTNEDYDFNYRVRQSGKKVILDRSGYCDYFARTTLRSLANQYARYGRWKAEMIRLHPGSMKLRHIVAPTFVFSVVFLAAISSFWATARWLLLLDLGIYLIAAVISGWHATRRSRNSRIALWLWMPLIFAVIHITWGASFWGGIISGGKIKKDQRSAIGPNSVS